MGRGPAAAVDALSAAVGAQPGRADLWSELATALVAAGRGPEAWDAAVRAVELAPRSAASHRAIGSVAAALGDTAQADAAYRHAARLDPAGAPDSGGGRHDAAYGQAGVLDPGGPPAAGGGRHDAAYGQAGVLDPGGPPDSGAGRAAPGAAVPEANGSRHAAPTTPRAAGTASPLSRAETPGGRSPLDRPPAAVARPRTPSPHRSRPAVAAALPRTVLPPRRG